MDTNLNMKFMHKLSIFKENIYKSKKYWIIYLALIIFASISMLGIKNYQQPLIEIALIIIVALLGIICISFYSNHNNNKQLYKFVFIVILTFGIVCSILSPICCAPDEVEHFVRSEMTSRGEFFPNYENGSYLTIQSTIDLINDSAKIDSDTGYYSVNGEHSSILKTDSDTKPINTTLVKFPSAFAQNPFYGYLPQAIGMFIAKLFNLNCIWLLWLGRIFNTLLYASLVAIAVKKTPILKIPLFIISVIPLSIFQCASLSIDSMVNGLGILTIAYFFYLYKSPDYSLNKKHIIIFCILSLLLGLCKITYFIFIFLILFVPKQKFEEKRMYYKSIIYIAIIGILAILWIKFYVTPGTLNSFRGPHMELRNINPTAQLSFILSHPRDFLISMLEVPKLYFDTDLLFNSRIFGFNHFNSFYLMFLGTICLLYPKEEFDIKSRAGALVISTLLYFGTYVNFLFSWTPVSNLEAISGVQPRYFLPLFALFPFIFGINNNTNNNTYEIDFYLITIAITFLASMLLSLGIRIY